MPTQEGIQQQGTEALRQTLGRISQAEPLEDNWKHKAYGMRCRTCRAFVLKATDPSIPTPGISEKRGAIGRCRNHSPTMQGFPVVFEMDWCLDHKLDENKA